MSEVEFTFNGPPPKHGGRGRAKSALRVALDEHPGEWATVEYADAKTARARAWYWNQLDGYEGTSRGEKLYARKVPS